MAKFKKQIGGIILGAVLLAAAASPSVAATGNSITPEIMNQSKALASVIMSRVHVLWSDYIDKQLEYTNNPSEADEPEWADELELQDIIGGTAPDGITFREVDMPTDRNDSFNLEVTVGPQFGGAASARYIKAYLPTATVEGNIVTIPVTRPSKALGLADLQIKELSEVEKIIMAPDANIEMANGDITGVDNIETKTINATKINTYDLDVTNMLKGNEAQFTGDVDIEGNLTVGPGGNNGHIYLGNDSYIHGGTNSDLTIGGSTNTSKLANLIVNATLSQFKGKIEAEDIRLIKNGVTTEIGSTNGSSFTIDSSQPILLSHAGETLLRLAHNDVEINAPLTLQGDLLPSAHNTYDVGKSSNSWKNIYASGKFFGNLEGNVHGYATDLKVGDSQSNPYGLNVTWAQQASRAVKANSADNASKFFNEGGNVNGILYANKGVMAKQTGTAMWGGWNQVYGVNTGSHGAFHNPTGGAFVGLHNNSNIYFGRSQGSNNGQYYGWVNSRGYYNGSGQKLATEAFVTDKTQIVGTAINALKLGGYNADDYMRKDEVKDINSSYETIEWESKGTYYWEVPEGVTKLNVTTVGGGGGGSLIRTTEYKTGMPLNIFTGGNGGEIKENVILTVKPKDVITISIGSGGKSISNSYKYKTCSGWYPALPSDFNKSGSKGEDTYIKINDVINYNTIAKGGEPGSVEMATEPSYNGANEIMGYQPIPTPTYNGGGSGGLPFSWVIKSLSFSVNGYNGKIGAGGIGSETASTQFSTDSSVSPITNPCTKQKEYYLWSGGGGSYGNGQTVTDTAMRVKRGGGGGTLNVGSNTGRSGGSGYVKIGYTRIYSE